MEQYIKKSALVAEIERRLEKRQYVRDKAMWNDDYWSESDFCIRDKEDEELLTIIDTLEVKHLQEESVIKVWHDASERPDYNVGKTVIVGCNDDNDLYDECNHVAYHVTLSIFVSRKDLNTRVVRWAYLKDLI